jgi:hypothetical protein
MEAVFNATCSASSAAFVR